MAISVVLLSYKEAENLKVLIPQIIKYISQTKEQYEIIVVDSQTALDNTEDICKMYGVKYVNQRYPFFAGAFRTGIEESRYDKFLIMDSDGSHNPCYIPDIYREFNTGADVVIGSRYVKGGKTKDAVLSVFMSRILNYVFRIVIGTKARDISTDFRMYDTVQLKNVVLECNYYNVLQEVLLKMRFNNKNLVVKEVPILFDKRLYGKSKRKLLLFVAEYIKTVVYFLNLKIINRNKYVSYSNNPKRL